MVLPALGAMVPLAAGQVDFSISKLEVNQSVQLGSTPLVAGRATFVRAAVRVVNGPVTPHQVDGLLRIFIDGVEAPGSPIYSDNGPFPAVNPSNFGIENGTLNFILLAPDAQDVILTVEVNPAGPNFVPEQTVANNSFSSAPLDFLSLRAPELAYVPIDYRPSGGSIPNLPDPARIEPGMGDNFIQGIYPSADWHYHRTDAPSKLWTSSLSGSGSTLLNSLQVDLNLMQPRPDFLYGYVPGGLPYNGQAFINGKVSMGNTELSRFQRTFAHELGHNFGLQHNSLTTGVIGVDVEHHLNLTQTLPQIKAATLKDIMYAGLLTHEAWVHPTNYNYFVNHPVFDPDSLALTDSADAPQLMVAGLWNKSSGTIELTDVLTLPTGTATPPADPRTANLVVRAWSAGELVVELPLQALTSADECPACVPPARTDSPSSDADIAATTDPLVPFHALLPAQGPGGAPIDRLVVLPAGIAGAAGTELRRSSRAPQVAFAPQANALTGRGPLTVAWNGTDPDGDALRYYLRYSPDGERFVPLATGLAVTQVEVDFASLPAPRAGKAFFELLTSDGLDTVVTRTHPLTGDSEALGSGNAPWVEIYAPDTGFSFREGATVVLHSSGWDLEDRALDGESVQWSSSIDGPIASGRLTTATTLSPGQHVITVQVTDSNGLVDTDSATITIVPRGLPETGDEVCQQDLGFGGPGSAELSMCGGDLSAGTSASVALTGGPAFSAAFLVAGFTNAPQPLKGGLIVPFPWTLFVPVMTNGAGAFTISGIEGGAGPMTMFLQCVIADAGQAEGFAFSNALQVNLLP